MDRVHLSPNSNLNHFETKTLRKGVDGSVNLGGQLDRSNGSFLYSISVDGKRETLKPTHDRHAVDLSTVLSNIVIQEAHGVESKRVAIDQSS